MNLQRSYVDSAARTVHYLYPESKVRVFGEGGSYCKSCHTTNSVQYFPIFMIHERKKIKTYKNENDVLVTEWEINEVQAARAYRECRFCHIQKEV